MRRNLRNRRVLITGASRGIGRCLAKKLAAEGARLTLAARSATELEHLAATLRERGTDVLAAPTDITCAADRRRLLDTVIDHFGGLDVLINNAGVSSRGHFATSTEAILRQVMEVNFFAPAELIRSAVPLLTRGEQPAIVNVASILGRRALPAWPEHSASKYALVGLTEALRGEMCRFDIDVLLVLPGLIKTGELSRHLLRDEGKMKMYELGSTTQDQVADAALTALLRNRTETVVGNDARWLQRVNRLVPWFVDWMCARKVKQLYSAG